MIRAGKYSVFEGSVFDKEKHDVPSISRYLVARKINVFLCKHKPTPERHILVAGIMKSEHSTSFLARKQLLLENDCYI